MNDNDIIKALKCCLGERESCRECPAYNYGSKDCVDEMLLQALDLINRQKAEIEALKLINSTYCAETITIREIAIKEFAVSLKAKRGTRGELWDSQIDNLVKEMTEGEDEN